jgi:hypothetical protein
VVTSALLSGQQSPLPSVVVSVQAQGNDKTILSGGLDVSGYARGMFKTERPIISSYSWSLFVHVNLSSGSALGGECRFHLEASTKNF